MDIKLDVNNTGMLRAVLNKSHKTETMRPPASLLVNYSSKTTRKDLSADILLYDDDVQEINYSHMYIQLFIYHSIKITFLIP